MLIVAEINSVHAASLLDHVITDRHAGNWARSQREASLAVRHRVVRWPCPRSFLCLSINPLAAPSSSALLVL